FIVICKTLFIQNYDQTKFYFNKLLFNNKLILKLTNYLIIVKNKMKIASENDNTINLYENYECVIERGLRLLAGIVIKLYISSNDNNNNNNNNNINLILELLNDINIYNNLNEFNQLNNPLIYQKPVFILS